MRLFGLWTYLFQIFCPIFCATAVPSLLVNQISVPILSTKKKKNLSSKKKKKKKKNLFPSKFDPSFFFFLGGKIIKILTIY